MKSKHSRRKEKPQGNEKKPFFQSRSKVETANNKPFFQPKLEISPANDPAEKEADDVANQVVDTTQTHNQGQSDINRKEKLSRQAEEEEEMQAKRIQKQEEEEPQAKRIQKQEEEEEAVQAKEEPTATAQPARQDKGKNDKPETAPSSFEDRLNRTKGKGFALPDDLQDKLEAEFGVSFQAVRIHTDAEAIALCQSIRAQAFTHGYDIYFNQNKYQPRSQEGIRLLAHELTHVVQQKGK